MSDPAPASDPTPETDPPRSDKVYEGGQILPHWSPPPGGEGASRSSASEGANLEPEVCVPALLPRGIANSPHPGWRLQHRGPQTG